MTTNLVELLKEQFSENAVSHLGTVLSENPAVIRKALSGVLPTVVGGVAHHIKDPSAPESILALLRSSTTEERLTDAFIDPARTQAAYATGEPLLTRIFGTRTDAIVSALATYSGANPNSVTSLLKLAAATLLGLLTRELAGTSQTATGLTSLMEGQADVVGKAMPVGLASLLPLIGITETATDTTTVKHSTPVTPVAPLATESTSGTPWLRWLLILLGILLLLWLLRTCLTDKKTTPVVASDTTSVVAPVNTDTVASAVGSSVGDSTASPTVQVDVELPGGRRLKVAERSFNANLATYLASKPKAPFRTFTFDNLTFDTNSAAIRGESQTHVNDLIEIMKAYPELVIKIEGHTDNTGSEATNETLSQERADAVKAALVKAGVTGDRISTKGFAAEKPTATNKTSEGRHENRRIDVVIVKA